MPDKNEILIEKLVSGGESLARRPPHETVFVPYGAPGDKVVLNRWESRNKFSRAWIQTVLKPSPQRVSPPCPYFFKPGAEPEKVCGGCDWQHLGYAFQTQAKKEMLIEAFQRIGRIAHPKVEEPLPSPNPWRYRNKVQIPFAERHGQLIAGFYAPGSHHIVPFEDCLIQSEESVRIFKAALEWFRKNRVQAYQEDAQRGWLRHLLIRTNAQGEALVAVVANGTYFTNAVDFARHMKTVCPSVKSLFQNVNTRPGNVILGPEWRHIQGRHYLTETLLGLKFRLSPGAFFQVHHAMAETLYKKVEEFAEPNPQEVAVELYAGVGAIGQLLAKRARFVWGVEESPQAVSDAIESAHWNGIKNVRFLQGRCESVLMRGRFHGGIGGALGAVVVDPPRAGCEQHVLRAIVRLAPRRIVYVSCDPATLARDARYLTTGGYLMRKSVPVDLFPQTAHIESVSLFTK
ncbi:MAG: 23S rRNA (uracil(1939)-C(5))-methyltransferase RlmD [Elusimicrobia bacterium]|nr:23S rRNA (uracil(1939)-C(5))-methyltransferase RlmD [Elusimicrobiota bacterium]